MEFENGLLETHLSQFLTLGKTFSRIYLKISSESFGYLKAHKDQILKSNIGLCVRMKLVPGSKGEISKDLYRDTPVEHFSKASEDLASWNIHFAPIPLTSEIELHEDHLNLLAPTLQYISYLSPKFILINPGPLNWDFSEQVKNQLLHYQMYSPRHSFVYFSPDHPFSEHWEARTNNAMKGPKFLDIDLSNACTHNCNFCGLYADEAIALMAKNSGGELSPAIKAHMKSKIDLKQALNLINNLPDKVEVVTFGGMGDPMTHTDFFEIAESALKRGFKIHVISNFAYFSEERLKRLSSLASFEQDSIYFLVNLSAGTAATYQKVRSNQPAKTFERVIQHLKYSSDLYRKNGRGIRHRLINVTTKDNYQDMPEMVGLAKFLSSHDLWIKPLEIHGEASKKLLIQPDELLNYALKAKLALYFADQLNVMIHDREVLETIIKDQENEITKYEQNQKSFESQINEEIEASEHLRKMLNSLEIHEEATTPRLNPAQGFSRYRQSDFTPPTITTIEAAKTKDNLGVIASGSHSSSYFSAMPCHIGYEYLRITTDGQWLPCCISNYPIHTQGDRDFLEYWLSGKMVSFREKMKKINSEKFHLTDPQWMFCQQCVHRLMNEDYNRRAGFVVKFSKDSEL